LTTRQHPHQYNLVQRSVSCITSSPHKGDTVESASNFLNTYEKSAGFNVVQRSRQNKLLVLGSISWQTKRRSPHEKSKTGASNTNISWI